MNLLFLASWYPDSKSSRNGLFIWQHAVAVAKHTNYELALVAAISQTGIKGIKISTESIDGVQHWVATYPKANNPVLRSWRYIWALHCAVQAKEKAAGKSDLVVVNVLWRAGLLAWIYQLLFNRPYIIIEHWSGYLPEGEGYKGFNLKYFTRLIADRAERILPVSSYLASSMQGRGLLNRYQVLPNIIDTDTFKPKALKIENQPIRLLHISNLAAEKNFDFVVEIWQELKRSSPAAQLLVAGAYTEESRRPYVKYADIQWLGFLDAAALAKEYQQATVLCMPSLFETFSIVIGEALACGCPVMAADLPTFDFYKKAVRFQSLPLENKAVWESRILEIHQTQYPENDFQFIDNNFSGKKVSERMVSIIEGISF